MGRNTKLGLGMKNVIEEVWAERMSEMEMEESGKEEEGNAIRAASDELSRQFKTLITSKDLHSLQQSQHTMYVPFSSLFILLLHLFIFIFIIIIITIIMII